jgi:5-methylcytosine-specific restriction endonuclease McrA
MAKPAKTGGARAKLRAFFEANLGKIVTSKDLREAAGTDVSEWARRVRELRNEVGMQILTHNDRSDLKPNEYILESIKLRPVIARGISGKLRRQILERNGFTCRVCGAAAGEESGCEPPKRCRLQVDHVVPISQGGTDDEHNLRAVCVYYNKDKADVIRPASGQAISALAVIRKLPRDVQLEVYGFLAKKFGKPSADK